MRALLDPNIGICLQTHQDPNPMRTHFFSPTPDPFRGYTNACRSQQLSAEPPQGSPALSEPPPSPTSPTYAGVLVFTNTDTQVRESVSTSSLSAGNPRTADFCTSSKRASRPEMLK
ncbi:hypothetical protein DPMN_151103 [Dreissena polymorpha]|uniref:Uncharacterized protein n=1 Tax=Dreissena polymorpha TaxID=45954 RepID=A0A9D4FKJ0_DREPO|nr:hypothetical protein DPMN_151103 [Dreissena polymorpha]